MREELIRRFFSPSDAYTDPFTYWAVVAIAVLCVVSGLCIWIIGKLRVIPPDACRELQTRWKSWMVICTALLLPIIFGPAWVMIGVCVLSLLCYREFARATGLFREKRISVIVVLGIVLVSFAVADNYSRLFFASAAFVVGLVAVVTIPEDRPEGYLQRVALGGIGFLLFGYSLGYLGFFANSPTYRSTLILIVLCVELNDVFAFCVGKLAGGAKVLPQTSPGKTWAGCIGAALLTSVLVAVLGHFVFWGTALDRPVLLIAIGLGLSVLGQFGDLLMSSIKRDIGIKDLGSVLPAHGGLLDRFDSLLLVPPAAFHFISLVLGPIGSESAQRIFTGGG